MFAPDILSFQEFIMGETLPLSTVHNAVLEFLKGRNDVVVFGAQAVNAYVAERRLTQDVDLQSTRASELAEELRSYLHERFQIAVRIREVSGGMGFRLYQLQEPANRHLADVRSVATLPPARRISGIPVMAPVDLIASKVISHEMRRGRPKSGTDWRDLAMLLLAFPELKQEHGPVWETLERMQAGPGAIEFWRQLVSEEIRPEDDDAY